MLSQTRPDRLHTHAGNRPEKSLFAMSRVSSTVSADKSGSSPVRLLKDRFRNRSCVQLLSSGGTVPDNELESSSSRFRPWSAEMDGEILPERFLLDSEISVTVREFPSHRTPRKWHGEVAFVHV